MNNSFSPEKSLSRASLTKYLAAVFCSAAACIGFPAYAASDTWDGTAGDNLWQSLTNWSADAAFPGTASAVYTSTDDATFSTTGATATIDLGGTLNVRSLIFGVGGGDAASFSIGDANDTLNITSGGGITINSGVTTAQTIGAVGTTINLSSVTASTATIANNGTGLLTIAGNIVGNGTGAANTIASSPLLTVSGSGDVTVTGAITKPSHLSLLKTGSGTLTLSNGSSFDGNGAIGYVPTTQVGFPLVVREGTLRLNGGTHTITGEAVIGGVVANGGAGQNARIQVDAGALNVSSWLSIGRGNGIGTVSSDLILNGTASVTAANLSGGFNGGNSANLVKGSITLNGTSSLSIGNNGAFNFAESAGSNFTMTLNDASTFTLNGSAKRYLGQGGTGVVNINGGTFTNNSSGVASLDGAPTNALYIGYNTGTGTLNMTSGTFSSASSEVQVGGSDVSGAGNNSTGTINFSGGTMTVGALTIARGNANTNLNSGTVNVSGSGTLNVAKDLTVGYAGNSTLGKLTITSGTVNVGTSGARALVLGQWDTSKGQVDLSGGAINLFNNSSLKMSPGNTSTAGPNVFNQNGGSVTFYSDAGLTVGGTGALDMKVSGAGTGSNTYNLNGGTLTAPMIKSTSTSGTRIFNFNGGMLKAAITTGSFFNLGSGGTTAANVRDGGAMINSNGFDITVQQPLVHSTIGGDAATDGGLTKSGAGTLTLAGANTYTGATTINGGTLRVNASLNTSSAVSVGAGAGLTGSGTVGAVTVTGLGGSVGNGTGGINTSTFTLSSLTFNTGGSFSLNKANDTNATVALTITGALTTTSGIALNVATSPVWANGSTYNLISYGSFSGSNADFTLGTIAGLGARQSATIGNTGAGAGFITLAIDGDTPYWTGAQSSAWTTATVGGLQNWKLQTSGSTTEFLTNDQVLFDDNATGTTSVDITDANVSVASLTFNNNTKEYTISSSGGFGIIGSGALIKSGTGKVTLTTNNSYIGATTINAGTVQVGNGGTTGSLPTGGAITNNGELIFNRSNTVTQGTEFSSAAITGTGSVTHAGTGTLALNALNTYSGPTTINSGTLQLGAGGAGSIASSSAITNNGTIVFNSTDAVTYASVISGSGSVRVNGGTTYLNATNTYSGGTVINAGTLVMGSNVIGTGNANALGSGTVTMNGGSLELGYVTAGANAGVNYHIPNNFTLNGGSIFAYDGHQFLDGNVDVEGTTILGTTFNSGAVDADKGLFLTGIVSGTGNLTIQHTRYATGQSYEDSFVAISGTANTFSGTATVNENTASNEGGVYLGINSSNALANATVNIPTNIPGSNRKFGSSPIVFKTGIGGATFAALSGAADVVLTGYNQSTHAYASDSIALTVGGNGTSTTYSGVMSGLGGLTKVGAGTFTLSGSNTYAGATTIASGTLAIGANGGIANSSVIDIQNGATLNVSAVTNFSVGASQLLKGKGTLLGNATLSGTVAPGASAGTLNVTGNFTLAATAVMEFELQSGDVTIGNNVNDLIGVSGNLTLDGMLNVTELGGSLVNGTTYRLFNYTGSLTDNGLDLSSAFLLLHPGSVIDVGTNGQINLLVVPEPSTFLILLSGIGTLVAFRPRRHE